MSEYKLIRCDEYQCNNDEGQEWTFVVGIFVDVNGEPIHYVSANGNASWGLQTYRHPLRGMPDGATAMALLGNFVMRGEFVQVDAPEELDLPFVWDFVPEKVTVNNQTRKNNGALQHQAG